MKQFCPTFLRGWIKDYLSICTTTNQKETSNLIVFFLFVLTGLQQRVDGGYFLFKLAFLGPGLLQLGSEGVDPSRALCDLSLQSLRSHLILCVDKTQTNSYFHTDSYMILDIFRFITSANFCYGRWLIAKWCYINQLNLLELNIKKVEFQLSFLHSFSWSPCLNTW